MLSGKVYYEKTNNPQPNIAVYLSDSKGNRLNQKASSVSITNKTGLFSFSSNEGAKYVSAKCLGGLPIVKYIGNNTLVNFDISKCSDTELEEVVITVPVKTIDETEVETNQINTNNPQSTNNEESKGSMRIGFKNLTKGQKASVYISGLGLLGLFSSFIIKK